MSKPRFATTVILLSPARTGFEVFLVRRHRANKFLPNAWVFPGGRLDERDYAAGHARVKGGDVAAAQMGLSYDDAVAFLLAGARETFEEAGIWLGHGSLPEEARLPLANGTLDLLHLMEEHDAWIDLDTMRPWAWWVTPEAEPKRYDTRFFVACVENATGHHDDQETVDSGWFDPTRILQDYKLATFPLAPPTWWTLRELATHQQVYDVLTEAGSRSPQAIQPIMKFSESGVRLIMPGHPTHRAPPQVGLPNEIVYQNGTWLAQDVASPQP